MKKVFWALAAAFILFAIQPVIAQNMVIEGDSAQAETIPQDTLIAKSPKGAMLRSLILPGWGQFYNGKWFKGLVIGGTETGLIINAVIQNQLAVQSETLLDKEFYRENRSLSIWWLGGVILYSVADALVDAHLSDFDDSPNVTMNIEKTQGFDLQYSSVYKIQLKIPL